MTSHDTIRAALEVAGNPAAEDWYTATTLDSAGLHTCDIPILLNAPIWLADLLGEVGLLRTLKHRHEQTITELAARAEAAEAAIQRVRDLSADLGREGCDMARLGGILCQGIADSAADAAARILLALDGGEQ